MSNCNNKTVVLGGGSWGTALAVKLVQKNVPTTLYIRDKKQYQNMMDTNINSKYLPDFKLPKGLKYSNDLIEGITDVRYILLSVPTNSVRSVLTKIKGQIEPSTVIINSAKGIEEDTLLRISEISKEILPDNPFVALSGPTHAEEVVLDYPTSIVSTSEDLDIATEVQDLFMSENFRVYTNNDLVGVEMAGALKNVVALAAGILVGIGYGDNSMAALMTRGINEIARLGISKGASRDTFLGLTGIGDLIVTCMSEHSRNRKCGYLIGQGMNVKEAITQVGMVVEGIKTTKAAKTMFATTDVEKPIIDTLYQILYQGLDAKVASRNLMLRDPKHELEGL